MASVGQMFGSAVPYPSFIANPDATPDYEQVLADLIAMSVSMEQGAKDLRTFGEEPLRHVLVTGLSPRFGGRVSGETLNAAGKTDLLVRDSDGTNIFVGECKIWSGPKALIKGFDQLLDYATQVDRSLGLILFVRTKNLTRVIRSSTETLSARADVQSISQDAGTERMLRLKVTHPQDQEVVASVAVLFIALPNERSEELGGDVQDGGGLGELLGVEAELASLQGAGMSYQVHVLGPGEEPPPQAENVLLRQVEERNGGRVVIDAVPLTDEAAEQFSVGGQIITAEDEDGIRARTLLAEAMKWHVGVEIRRGLKISFDSFPPGLSGTSQELEDAQPHMVLEPQSEWSWPVVLHVETDRGEARAAISLREVLPEEGWQKTLRGSFHNLSISMNMGSAENKTEFRWRLHPTDASVRNRLAALDLLYAASGEGRLRWESKSKELPSTTFELLEDDLDASLIFERAFFSDLVTLEEWLDREFRLPAKVAQQQLAEIASAAALVRSQGGKVRWTGSTWRVPEGKAETGEILDGLAVELPVDVEIFGEVLTLGSGLTQVNAEVTTVEEEIQKGWVAATLSPRAQGDSVVEVKELKRPTGTEDYERY